MSFRSSALADQAEAIAAHAEAISLEAEEATRQIAHDLARAVVAQTLPETQEQEQLADLRSDNVGKLCDSVLALKGAVYSLYHTLDVVSERFYPEDAEFDEAMTAYNRAKAAYDRAVAASVRAEGAAAHAESTLSRYDSWYAFHPEPAPVDDQLDAQVPNFE